MSRENNAPTGTNPAVFYTPGCTGTIVGPHAVLTANHCPGSGVVGWVATGQYFSITNTNTSPYLQPQYTPDWWLNLNDAQKAAGGRQDDWPAQHDERIQFVADLTPTVLAANHILPVAVNANAPGGRFRPVGVSSTPSAAYRDSIPGRFINANTNTITQYPRDGYYSLDTGTANFGSNDPGDSGGPTLGYQVGGWVGGSTFEFSPAVFATTQNTGGDTAPLAYDAGITLTDNQRLTVRLNNMWVRARADDADADGLPYDCDPNPASPAWAGTKCPPELGGPRGADTASAPIGLIDCRTGYLPTAVKGRSGDLIDRIALKCSPITCIASGAACGDAYYTEEFGGMGGGAFEDTCPTGTVLAGFTGTDDASYIHSLAARCASYATLRSGGTPTYTTLATHGLPAGNAFTQACSGRGSITGLQARTIDKRWTTGLQAICGDTASNSEYVGGTGGGGSSLDCPTGTVAVGTVQRAEGSAVNVFGLICMDRASVAAGQNPATSANLTYAHAGFWYYAYGFLAPPAVEPKASAHLPAGYTETFCPASYGLSTVRAYYGSFLNRIDSLQCMHISASQTANVNVNVGPVSGPMKVISCGWGFGQVGAGLYTRSGWLTDGIMLKCRDKTLP